MTISRPSDFYAALTQIVAVCGIVTAVLATITQSMTHVPTWVAIAAIIVGGISQLASKLLTLQSNPSPPPGMASVVTPSKEPTVTATVNAENNTLTKGP